MQQVNDVKRTTQTRIIKWPAMALLLLLSLSACGAPSKEGRFPVVSFETIPKPKEETETVADDTTESAEESAENGELEKPAIHSVEEYIALPDHPYLSTEQQTRLKDSEAVGVYDAFLPGELQRLREYFGDSVRMGLGWIDEDDSPELFLCQADATAAGVWIYTIDAKTGEVKTLGEFSQYGNCVYTERKDRIWSQYGNQGYFQECISRIEDGKTKLAGAIAMDGSGIRSDDTLYYAGFPVPEGLTGSRDDLDFGLSVFGIPDNAYRVDEAAYSEAYHQLMRDREDGAVTVVMEYGKMVPLI